MTEQQLPDSKCTFEAAILQLLDAAGEERELPHSDPQCTGSREEIRRN